MGSRMKIINSFYDKGCENDRLLRSRHGQLEYLTTMHYIHKLVPDMSRILEVGAGTGRYAVTLAKEGHTVTAVELASKNFAMLQENSKGIETISAVQGDALDLGDLKDNTFDCTLVFGPLYHLYDRKDQLKALNEAVRVTKENGLVMVAFLSVHAIMFDNYLQGNWKIGEKENFSKDYQVRHFENQIFTGFNIDEFEALFDTFAVEKIATVAADGIMQLAEGRSDFAMSDEEFQDYTRYHLHHCKRRELLGCSSHLLYICKKRA